MKHSPEEIERRNEARKAQVTHITDPAELARLTAEHKAARLFDDGTDLIVADALHAIDEGLHRGRKRNLLNVVAQLSAHLTPEQQLGLAERLPHILSPEALAVLVDRGLALLSETERG